ncbi:MAG: sporulation protein YqfC [Eubacterium sp.]|jgi:sporulation protein YqfC|nr:sporulation protein YqfC [Eubacterium sp.]
MILKMSRSAVRKEKTQNKGRDQTRKKEVKKKQNLKERVTEILELPKEIVLNMPKLTMLGNGDLIVENYKGIVEYDEGIVRLNTTSGIIKVSGTNILIKEITLESIMIFGEIKSLEFLSNEQTKQ